ncbi:SGF29 tudor-like domain-containing protein [Cryomyces antarcticus]
MASRSRPRAGQGNDGVDEERRIWSHIRSEAKRVDALVVKQAELGKRIVKVEDQQSALIGEGKLASPILDDELETLYRDDVKSCEECANIIEGQTDGYNLSDAFKVLAALRESSENEPSQRSAATFKSRSTMKRQRLETEDNFESAAPSPKVNAGAARLKEKAGVASRSGSVPAVREPSVKLEDGADSSSIDGMKASDRPGKGLSVGTEVFYRNKTKAVEGEGILCNVTNVIGEGKQRRYEIQDADPDPIPATGQIPPPYRASVSNLVAIPLTNAGLPDLPAKKNVLALYPGTTTFYKAEVSAAWRAATLSAEKGDKAAMVSLRFEGEEEVEKEMDVERRYVLVDR